MDQQRMKKETISLFSLMLPAYFRTVESFDMRKAPSEVAVEINLKDNFRETLSFPVEWDGILYAYALETKGIADFRAKHGYPVIKLLKLTLSGWDECFCLTAEYAGPPRKESSFFVSSEDVRCLLENCRRIPPQMQKKK
jgi:hypothetical protein